MPSPANLDIRLCRMQISSPRSPLDCQALSLDLPLPSDPYRSRPSGRLPPMSIPPIHPNALQYRQKPGTPRYNPISPKSLAGNEIRSPTSHQSRLGDHAGSHMLSDSPEYTVEAQRGSLYASTESGPDVEGSYDVTSSTTLNSPGNMNLTMDSPGVARRAKAHVPSACVNCKRKHLACETRRPCNRCLQSGKEATCIDVQHKKRGRPRLRDEDNARGVNFGSEYPHPQIFPAQPDMLTLQGSSQHGHHRTLSYRELRSQPDSPYGEVMGERSSLHRGINPGFPGMMTSQDGMAPRGLRAIRYLPEINPTALLTLDFVICRSNHAFSDALALRTNAEGKLLNDLVIPSEREKIQRLQNNLRAEMHESTQAPYPRASMNEYVPSNNPEGQDIFDSTVGFEPRSEYWTFRLPNGQSRGYPISISLAKTDAYFVVLTLVSSAKPMPILPASHGGWIQPMSIPTSAHGVQPVYPDRLVERPRSREINTMALPYQGQPPKSVPQGFPSGSRGMESSYGPDLRQYRQQSPSQTYDSGSAGSAETNRSSPRGYEVPEESLRHLQLPPIRTDSTRDSGRLESSKTSASTWKESPGKADPQSGKRKKRRRVDIGEMLR